MPRFAPRRRATTITAAACALAGLIVLAVVGLSPSAPQRNVDGPLFRFLLWAQQTPGYGWLTFDRLEAVSNVLLFVPMGAIAFLLLPRRLWPVSLLICPALSVAIEIGQGLLLPGRTASIEDVALNSLGATIGFALAVAISLPIAARSARLNGIPTSTG